MYQCVHFFVHTQLSGHQSPYCKAKAKITSFSSLPCTVSFMVDNHFLIYSPLKAETLKSKSRTSQKVCVGDSTHFIVEVGAPMFPVKGFLRFRGQSLGKYVTPGAVRDSHFCPFRGAVKVQEKPNTR